MTHTTTRFTGATRRVAGASVGCLVAGLALAGCAPTLKADGGLSDPVTPEEQMAYGCELIDQNQQKSSDEDGPATDNIDPESAVVNEIVAAAELFGGSPGTSDPVDEDLEETGAKLYPAVQRLNSEKLSELMERAASQCKDFRSKVQIQPANTDTSGQTQMRYGCRLVGQTLKKYPDHETWEKSRPKLGSDRVWNELLAAGALLRGANPAQKKNVADQRLQKLGTDMTKAIMMFDTKQLDTSLNAMWDRCQEMGDA